MVDIALSAESTFVRCRAGRVSEHGFHYDATNMYLALEPTLQAELAELGPATWKEAAAALADLAVATGFTPVLPEVNPRPPPFLFLNARCTYTTQHSIMQ
jgi:hypothetical protein